MVQTSYSENDVIVLLKDLTGIMKPLSTEEREKAIQSGVHYSEMLPLEKRPTEQYMKLFYDSMNRNKVEIANGMLILAEQLYKLHGENLVIISLARAGLPVGIILKRIFSSIYNLEVPHYGISIIRGKGIDVNAMNYIYENEHLKGVEHFQFVDGWTGKGAIAGQLDEAVEGLKRINDKWLSLKSDLAVLADPANICYLRGTNKDFLLPSSCLNSTVSGLTSRTILNSYIEENDYHGAVYFKEFEDIDLSNYFVDEIMNTVSTIETIVKREDNTEHLTGLTIVSEICKHYNINDITKVKPGIGETTRVLLRRVPWKVLINTSLDDADIAPILELCKEKNVPYEFYNMGNYKVCGLIKDLSADA